MQTTADLADFFERLGLADWAGALGPLVESRYSGDYHGDYPQWRETLLALRASSDRDTQRQLLRSLAPWRKGPFEVNGIVIDAEWRSDLKWQRVLTSIDSLAGKTVLDVGCGNGYYARQMRAAGAAAVLGIDPTLLYLMQFHAIDRFEPASGVLLLPLRLNELPPGARHFDLCFSMGVLYHQRSPVDHLRELRGMLRQGGELVLETLFLPGEAALARTPEDRYARMRNVWLLPTLAELNTWLSRSGYRDLRIVDQTVTGSDEQRSTEWMPFDSLAEALDPADPALTVEGWPAPRRVIVLAKTP